MSLPKTPQMLDSKAYYYLSFLTKSERSRFQKYLESPYFNTNPRYIKLLQTLEKELIEKQRQGFSRKDLFEIIFSGRKFTAQPINRLLTDYLKHFFNFVALEIHQGNRLGKEEEVFEFLIQRGADKYLSKLLEDHEKELEDEKGSVKLVGHKFEFERLKYISALGNSGRLKNPRYNDVLRALESYFLAKGLRFILIGINQDQILNTKSTFQFEQRMLQLLKNDSSLVNPLMQAFLLCHDFLQGIEEQSAINQLLDISNSPLHQCDKEAQEEFLLYVLNHCIRRRNSGETWFLEAALKIYDRLIEKKNWIENGKLSYENYKNYISLKCENKELDSAKQFAKVWGDKIKNDKFGESYEYALGMIEFIELNYSGAIKHLDASIRSKGDVFITLDARVLILKACFANKDEFYFLDQCDSFRAYLNRLAKKKQLSEFRIARYRTFLILLRKLGNAQFLTGKKQVKAKAELLDLIANSKGTFNTAWVEKMAALTSRKTQYANHVLGFQKEHGSEF